MKKRLCAGLLVLAMLFPTLTAWITPVSAAKVDPIAVVDGTEDNSNSAPYAKYATNEGAALKKLTFAQDDAWNLKIRSEEVRAGCQTYVVILRYDLFDSNYNRDGDIGGIDASSYSSLRPGTSNPNYYRTENHTAVSGEALDIFNQSLYNFNNDRNYQVGASSTTYHMKYAAIIFDGATKLSAHLTDYTIVTFYMDSEGYLQRDSYMLRYIPNAYPTGNGTVGSVPSYQIEDWGADATVNKDTIPSRRGYKFLGWDPTEKLMPADANTAAASPATPKFPRETAGPVAWTDITAKFTADYKTGDYEKNRDKFYNLYAVWQPNQVKFDYTNASDTLTVGGQNVHVLTLSSPQVGVAYSQTISLDISANSTTDRNTAKTYSWINGVSAGAQLTDAESNVVATTRNISNDFSLTVTANGNTQWRISGTPGNHSDGKDVYTVLQVKDNDNNTTDWIILHFDEVKRRAQPIPAMDANTGLQSRIETRKVEAEEGGEATEVQDGQIFGLYPTGPITMADNVDNTTGYVNPTGNVNTGTNGVNGSKNTGTMTGYYKALGMAYEYRPAKIQKDGQTLTLVDSEGNVTEAGETYFASQPNGGWREVPYPQDWYAAAYKAQLADTMGKNAAKLLNSAKVALTNMNQSPGNNATATVTATETPWPDEYGYIEFEAETNLPVIHGLNADDIYELRFKKNATSEVSQGRQISIGGAVAAGGGDDGGSGGVSVSLSGGTIGTDDAADYGTFVADCGEKQPGDTITIPSFKPVRATYTFLGWKLGPTDGATESGEGKDLYQPGETVTVPEDTPVSLSAVWNSTTEGVIAVTAFDWDGTMLGSFVFRADENADRQEANAQAALAQFMGDAYKAPTEEPGDNTGDDNDDGDDNSGGGGSGNESGGSGESGGTGGTGETGNEPAAHDDETEGTETPGTPTAPTVADILKSHAGYDFLNWVKNEDDIPTSYGKRVETAKNTSVVDLALSQDDVVNFGTLKESTTIKAAYTTNDSIVLGSSETDTRSREYKTSVESYGRFGTGSSFAIRIKVERGNVPRSTIGALRVRMVVGGADIYSQYPLSGADVETIEVVPYARSATNGTFTGASLVEWTVIDTYGTTNWVGSDVRTTVSECQSEASFNVQNVGTAKNIAVWATGTYPLYGIVASLNQTLEDFYYTRQENPNTAFSTMTAVSLATLRSIGIPPASINTVRENLYNAWCAINVTDGVLHDTIVGLTFDEIYAESIKTSVS